MVISHLGDKPSRRQSSRRQTNSATRVGQLGDNLFRLSVCFVLIEQVDQENRAILHVGLRVQELATLLNCHSHASFYMGTSRCLLAIECIYHTILVEQVQLNE